MPRRAHISWIAAIDGKDTRLYPVSGAPWRRLLFPVVGSLAIGYLPCRYFPGARGSGVPQTKAALFASGGRISLRTVLRKFFCNHCWSPRLIAPGPDSDPGDEESIPQEIIASSRAT